MIDIPHTVDFKSKISSIGSDVVEAFNNTGLPQMFAAQKGDNTALITLYDVIGSPKANANTFAQALEDAAGVPLTIRLSSCGGSVFDGLAMYNSLKAYKGESTVIVDGVCASIASVIALGADHVQTAENSLWMIHNAWVATAGNSADLRDSAGVLDRIDATMREIYASKTGTDPAKWHDIMAAETWYTSDEAMQAKLVDSITPQASTKSAKAALNPNAMIKAAFDPDGDGDDDAAEAVGLVSSAVVLLQEAIEALTGQDDDDDVQALLKTKLTEQRIKQAKLRVRRAIVSDII